MLNYIQEQCRYADEVMQELKQSAALFGETWEMILQHIADANVVDEKLAEGIKQLPMATTLKERYGCRQPYDRKERERWSKDEPRFLSRKPSPG
ncbi:hypothetical protein [Geobacillus stearothermophilus]|uniref:hypothetical protein n=1 Tax=Geobacillus stearothermophilus TaxID=1422 RepID=UPI003D228684